MTNSSSRRPLYSDAGVDTDAASRALGELLPSVRRTFDLPAGAGRPLLDIGYFANVIDLGAGLGLAISTDGVGSKILIAQMIEKYDTIGIDCVAMNVNDVICVGAEPIAMTDYIGVQVPDPVLFRELGKGLLKGAEASGISIPGGEVAQIAEMIRGVREGSGFDLVGTCVGVVATNRILTGQDLEDGDVIVGLASSGMHSNGFSLARRVLLDSGRFTATSYVAELGRTLGEELLEPTLIYVRFAVEALRAELPVKSIAHITGDGLLNVARVSRPVGFEIEEPLDVPPIFELIQRTGEVSDAEMFTVFNMGTGLCVVVAPASAGALIALAAKHGFRAKAIGRVWPDPDRTVRLRPRQLVSSRGTFVRG